MRLQGQVIFRVFVCLFSAAVFFYVIDWIFVGDVNLKQRLPPGTYLLYIGFFLLMWVHSDSTVLDKGLLRVQKKIPQFSFIVVSVFVLIGAWLRISGTQSESFHRLAPVYVGLAAGYGMIFFISLFGANFLGIFSQFLKFSRRD